MKIVTCVSVSEDHQRVPGRDARVEVMVATSVAASAVSMTVELAVAIEVRVRALGVDVTTGTVRCVTVRVCRASKGAGR